MSKIHGLVTAKVKDRNSLGQVMVTYPWLTGKNDGLLGAGGHHDGRQLRGSWFMPEKGDDVLVAFDHGDFDHPYVVGFLWNGQNKPPAS